MLVTELGTLKILIFFPSRGFIFIMNSYIFYIAHKKNLKQKFISQSLFYMKFIWKLLKVLMKNTPAAYRSWEYIEGTCEVTLRLLHAWYSCHNSCCVPTMVLHWYLHSQSGRICMRDDERLQIEKKWLIQQLQRENSSSRKQVCTIWHPNYTCKLSPI